MRKSKFTEQPDCRCTEAGRGRGPVKDLCRDLGVSAATFYQWRSK